jgi:hypothetical protein
MYPYFRMTKDDKNVAKSSQEFNCKICDYVTSKQSNYDKHLLTSKHKKSYIELQYTCECGKKYKHRQGLWKHKKNCEMLNAEVDIADVLSDKESDQSDKEKEKDKEKDKEKEQLEKELLVTFMKEMKDTMLEMFKHLQPNNTTMSHSHNNSHNNTFNLQFFLNEQCKDALNINEFVSSINIKLSDLENTGRLGYVEGISRILINNLKDLDTHKRPIHCSDLKREVLYIKSDDKWEKDDEDNQQIRSAIKQVAHKNIRQIPVWTSNHPECKDPTSKQNDQYLKIVSNSMSGITSEEQSKNVSQIIKNLAKEVVISKPK